MKSVDEIRHELAGDRPVYVVRCRGCRYSMYDPLFDIYYCAKLGGKHLDPDFFCAWGAVAKKATVGEGQSDVCD